MDLIKFWTGHPGSVVVRTVIFLQDHFGLGSTGWLHPPHADITRSVWACPQSECSCVRLTAVIVSVNGCHALQAPVKSYCCLSYR